MKRKLSNVKRSLSTDKAARSKESETIQLDINNSTYRVVVRPGELLLDVLREKLGLTGTKRGCDSGECGACTVLIDGKAIKSCRVKAHRVQHRKITTIEGLASDGRLDPLQQAFIQHGAVQCGYCTPGMILAAKSLFNRNPNPGQEEIKKALSGNICRCTGYIKIIEAVEAAASGNIRQEREPAF